MNDDTIKLLRECNAGIKMGVTSLKLEGENSDAVAADVITDGCNMGMKSLYKYLNQYPTAEAKVKDLAKELIRAEETLVEDLREYL